MAKKPFCCYIPDQANPEPGCQKPVEFRVWMGFNPTFDDYTECCEEHLKNMLDFDYPRFEILRITQEEPAPVQADEATCVHCGGQDYHHTVECYLGKPEPVKFHCQNCKDFRDVVLNQSDIVCSDCHWIIATYKGKISLGVLA